MLCFREVIVKCPELPDDQGCRRHDRSSQEENNPWLLVGRRLPVVLVFVQRKYALRQLLGIVPLCLAELDTVLCDPGAHLQEFLVYMYVGKI
jgi:hypothetical protein